MPAVGTSTAKRTAGPPGPSSVVERVDVEVGEITVADGDEVAECAEVRLEVGDRLPVAADGHGELGLGAGDERRRRSVTS